jgi:hypothetical protein
MDLGPAKVLSIRSSESIGNKLPILKLQAIENCGDCIVVYIGLLINVDDSREFRKRIKGTKTEKEKVLEYKRRNFGRHDSSGIGSVSQTSSEFAASTRLSTV